MGSVDPAYIDRLQEDIIIACHRLEEAGHESLVVTVSEEGHLTFGSQKGKQFLEDKHGFIKEFVFHCQNSETVVKVEAEVDEEEETILPNQQNNKTKQHKKLVSIIDRNLIDKVKGKDGPNKTEIDKDESVNVDENVDSAGGAERDMYDDDTDDNDDSEKFSTLIPKDETEPDDVTEDQVTGEDSMEMDGDNDFVTVKVEQPENKAEESPVLKRMKTIINSNKSSQVKVKWSALKTTKKGMWKKPKEIEPGPTSCDVCGKELSCWSSLMRHKISHHSDGRDHECEECGKKFKLAESLVRHKVVHKTEKDYKCEICNKAFKKLVYVTKHMDTHKLEKPYKCGQCEKCFVRKENLTAHERIHAGKQVIECKECDRRFNSQSHLNSHLKCAKHTGIGTKIKKIHKCEICDKVLSCRGGLTKHMARHSSVKPFICELCGKGVSSRSHLVDHMRRHTGERPYKCTIEGCFKTFRTLDCRSRHEVLHFNDYPFICDFCGTKFKRRNELRTHRRRKHELEFPWQCDFCPTPEKFKTIARFKNHMARLHVDKLEEVTEKTNIKFWRCEHCAKVFGSKDDFQQHVNIHLGLRPYICALCQKSFSNKSNLLQHKKSHFKKDLLQCPSCPKSYKDPSMFKEHLKNKHGSNIQEENITDPKGFKERLKNKYGSDKHDDNVTSDVEVETRHCRLDRVEAVDQNQILSPGGGWPVPRSIPSDRREADPSYVASVWVPGSSLVPPRTSQDWEGRTGFIGGNHF